MTLEHSHLPRTANARLGAVLWLAYLIFFFIDPDPGPCRRGSLVASPLLATVVFLALYFGLFWVSRTAGPCCTSPAWCSWAWARTHQWRGRYLLHLRLRPSIPFCVHNRALGFCVHGRDCGRWPRSKTRSSTSRAGSCFTPADCRWWSGAATSISRSAIALTPSCAWPTMKSSTSPRLPSASALPATCTTSSGTRSR